MTAGSAGIPLTFSGNRFIVLSTVGNIHASPVAKFKKQLVAD